jgi:hypothetical protein
MSVVCWLIRCCENLEKGNGVVVIQVWNFGGAFTWRVCVLWVTVRTRHFQGAPIATAIASYSNEESSKSFIQTLFERDYSGMESEGFL